MHSAKKLNKNTLECTTVREENFSSVLPALKKVLPVIFMCMCVYVNFSSSILITLRDETILFFDTDEKFLLKKFLQKNSLKIFV